MLERAFTAGVPSRWVTADEATSRTTKFRTWLENRRVGYVVAVARNPTVPTVEAKPHTIAGSFDSSVRADSSPATPTAGRKTALRR